MASAKSVPVQLLLDFQGGNLPQILEAYRLLPLENKTGLTWILHAKLVRELHQNQQAEAVSLRERLASGTDQLVLAGFTGLPPSTLFPTEFQKETDLPFTHHEIGILQYFQPQRRMVFLPSPPPPPLLEAVSGEVVLLWPIPGQPVKLQAWQARHPLTESPLALAPAGNSARVVLVEAGQLPAVPDWWTTAQPQLLAPEKWLPAPEPAAGFDLPLDEKLRSSALAQTRQSTSPALQSFFFKSPHFPGPGGSEAEDSEETIGGIRKRHLIANMQGLTRVTEGALEVQFKGGRLAGIFDRPTGRRLTGPGYSHCITRKDKLNFKTISAFSLEGDFSWGLRETLELNGRGVSQPGRLVLDYYFVEESLELFVSVSVRHPIWEPGVEVRERAILKLPVLEISRQTGINLKTWFADGASSESLITPRHKTGRLWGNDFILTGKDRTLVVSFVENNLPRPRCLAFQVARFKGKKWLWINPEGSFHPEKFPDNQALEEHFTLAIALWNQQGLPFKPSRKASNENIPPFAKLIDKDQLIP